MDTPENNESIPPINEALIDQARTIKKERDLYQDRLDRLDEKKGEVSESVHSKIRGDYLEKLNGLIEKFLDISRELKIELATLKEKIIEADQSSQSHQENLEEIKMRQSLGEFTEEELKEGIETEVNHIERLESLKKKLGENIAVYEDILEQETSTAKIEPDQEPSPFEMIEHPPPEEFEEVKSAAEPPPPPEPQDTTEKVTEETDRVPSLGDVISEEPVPSLSQGDYFNPLDDQASPPQAAEPAAAPPQTTTTATVSIQKSGQEIGQFPLGEQTSLGRSPSNNIVLKDVKISRNHAQIQRAGGKYILIDLESSNGTYINEKKVSEHTLQSRDIIRMGPFVLTFSL